MNPSKLTIGGNREVAESFAGTKVAFYAPATGAQERALLNSVLDSNYLNDGDITRKFEQMIADAVGVEHCVAVTSGTAAIAVALMAAGVEPEDEVLVPDLTFIATANAARLAGARVRLVDVEPVSFFMDASAMERAIGSKTKAVVTVDVNGRAGNYDEIARICADRGLKLICDSAEALGSFWGGVALGSLGEASCFSFSANKRICTGQGGALVTNDSALASRARELKDQGRRVQGTGGDDLHPVLGFNFKLTNLQAAVGVAQMSRLGERVEHARMLDRWYRKVLRDCDGIEIPEHRQDSVLQWFDVLVDRRATLSRALRARGIGHRAFWRPLHTQDPYRDRDEAFPVSIEIARKGLWLPSGVTMTEDDVIEVGNAVRESWRAAGTA